MATMTKLFEKVIANDYEWFESLVQSKKDVNWNSIRCKVSLVYKAIEMRSLKCFDILMNIPELTVFSNKSGQINGINKAIDYYTAAPNADNRYYLDKLLQKNIVIDSYTYIKCLNNVELCNMLFNNVEKKEYDIKSIIQPVISSNNMYMLNYIYDYLETTTPSFYTNMNKHIFNNMIFSYMLNYIKTPDMIQYIINKGVQWKSTNENMPTLYYGIKYNMDLVKFFIPLYQNLSPEELNAIPNIDNTNLLICSSPKINMDIYKSIIKLPINFKNTDKFIMENFKKIYQNYYGYSNTKENYLLYFKIIYLFFSEGKITSNPLNLMLTELPTINQYKDYMTKNINYNNNTNIGEFKLNFRKFMYINNHFNFLLPESMKNSFEWIFPSDIDILKEKDSFIKELTYVPPPVIVKVNKTRKIIKTSKKVQINNELDI